MSNGVNLYQANKQWATRPADQRFQTLEALAESVNSRRMRSRAVDIDLAKIDVGESQDTIVLNHGITQVEPSHWSFGQLCTNIQAPAKYLRTLPNTLAIQNLKHGIETCGKAVGALKFMTVAEEDKPLNTLQAVTSTTYGRIWDADCVAAVQRLVERSGGKFHNPLAYATAGKLGGEVERAGLYASDRDVFMFMIDGGSLLEAGPRAKLNRGFFCWNSEVGSRTFGLTTFLFNTVCGNNIVWGATDINEIVIRHTVNGPYRFDSEAAPLLLNYANQSAAPVESAIKRATEYIVVPKELTGDGDRFECINKFTSRYAKFTKSEVKSAIDFAKAEEGDCRTLWHVVQGLTAYARGFDWVDARVDLETRAGKLLDAVKN